MVNKIVLLGFYVGDKYFEEFSKGDAFPQVAAYKLERRFLEAIRYGGGNVTSIASLAMSTYPANKRIYFPAGSYVTNDGLKGDITPIINLPVLKLVSRFFGSMFSLFRRRNSDADILCVYAAHSPNLLAAYIFSKLFKTPFFVYIPDLPSFMDMGMNRPSFIKKLKHLDARLINSLLVASSGVFVTSEYMIKDNPGWRNKPYMVLEGIASAPSSLPGSNNIAEMAAGKRIIFYAGGINKAYGIVPLVEGFLDAQLDCELWLCGRGELEDFVQEKSRLYPKIKYLGFLSPEEVANIQALSTFLILSRSSEEIYTRYSFPSKLLEYMASGVPVLSTRLDGIPAEYYDFLNVIEEASADGVSSAIRAVFATDQEVLLDKAARGKIWLSENKSSVAVGRKITEFMERNQ